MGARTVLRVLQTCRRDPGGVVARMSPQGAPAHSWEWGRSSLQFPKEARVYPQIWVGGSTFELPSQLLYVSQAHLGAGEMRLLRDTPSWPLWGWPFMATALTGYPQCLRVSA